MERVKIINDFTVRNMPTGAEYEFSEGETYVVDYYNESEVCVFVDEADDVFEGKITLPTAYENENFEFIEDEDEF